MIFLQQINLLHLQFYMFLVIFLIFLIRYKRREYLHLIKKIYITAPLLAVFIILLIYSYKNLGIHKEKLLGINKPLLEYSISGKIFLEDENKNLFRAKIKNISSFPAKNVEIYIILKLVERDKYREIGKYSIAEIPPKSKVSISPQILSFAINERLKGVMPKALKAKTLESIILSAKYEDAKGNLYDDWISSKRQFSESKIDYKE